jgi:hypothetical protein
MLVIPTAYVWLRAMQMGATDFEQGALTGATFFWFVLLILARYLGWITPVVFFCLGFPYAYSTYSGLKYVEHHHAREQAIRQGNDEDAAITKTFLAAVKARRSELARLGIDQVGVPLHLASRELIQKDLDALAKDSEILGQLSSLLTRYRSDILASHDRSVARGAIVLRPGDGGDFAHELDRSIAQMARLVDAERDQVGAVRAAVEFAREHAGSFAVAGAAPVIRDAKVRAAYEQLVTGVENATNALNAALAAGAATASGDGAAETRNPAPLAGSQ